MPHVSGRKLNKKIADKIFIKLIKTFEDAHSKNEFLEFFRELFTRTEKKMLGKRLAIIIFLHKEIPQHRIADILKVSSSTVTRMSLNLETGKYSSIIKLVNRKNFDVDGLIRFLITAGGLMPPIVGRGRWTRIF